MILLDGKKIAKDLKDEITIEVTQLKASGGKRPHLAAILVGADGASETYINAKVKACEKVGFKSTLIRLKDNVTEKDLLNWHPPVFEVRCKYKSDLLHFQKYMNEVLPVRLPLIWK